MSQRVAKNWASFNLAFVRMMKIIPEIQNSRRSSHDDDYISPLLNLDLGDMLDDDDDDDEDDDDDDDEC